MATVAEKKGNNQSKESFFLRMVAFFKDKRTRFCFGLILLTFTVYSSIAFVSYFFTGTSDYSLIENVETIESENDEACVQEYQNWAGPVGAHLSYFFINDCFGVASFFLLALFAILAFRLMNWKILPLWKAIVYTILPLIWFSVSISFLFYSFYDGFVDFGGGYGKCVSDWLELKIGWLGEFLVIILSFLLFCVLFHQETIGKMQSAGGKCKSWFSNFKFKNRLEEGFSESENQEQKDEGEGVFRTEENHDFQKEDLVEEFPTAQMEKPNDWIEENPIEEDFLEGNELTIPTNDENLITKEDDLPMDVVTTEIESSEQIEPYNPRLDLEYYKFPPLDLLKEYPSENSPVINADEQNENKEEIVRTLGHFGIEIDSIKATVGPTITLYEIVPKQGTRINKIRSLADDIMLSLSAEGIRIIAPMPGKGTIGIEVPNRKKQIVSMHSVIASKKFQEESSMALPIALGRTITNEVFMFDLAKSPHLLVAGATGQGKSVGLNAIITSLLYKKHPSELKFVLIDPKMVEFNMYAALEKHYMAKLEDEKNVIITESENVIRTLNSLVEEMENRYKLLMEAHCRNIVEYNEKFIARKLNPEKGHRFLPYLVIIIDEYGDFIMVAGKEVETPISRITQKARAVGMHMILATQRPSVNIITGVIKANVPGRIAFRVSSMVDSRTILDASGAQQLVGKGDLLYSSGNNNERVQCAFVDTPEVESIVGYIHEQQSYATAYPLPEVIVETSSLSMSSDSNLKERDPMFEEAARIVVIAQQGSTSLIQRKLSLGYNHAGRIMDQLEAFGIVGPFEGSKARQVLIPDEYSLEQKLNSL